MGRLGLKEPILWLYRPEMHPLIGQFGEKLSVYHVVDEYTAYQGVNESLRDFLHQAELQLLGKANLVIAVSENLYQAKAPFNTHTFMIPNAVDYDAFRADGEIGELPEDLLHIPKPILGYIGLISARLNLSWLRHLLASLPHCSLVLLGSIDPARVEGQLQSLLSSPQVHYLGRRSPRELAKYLAHFDVCLIPYQMGEEARNADPLKVYEYLASGKPIVSTNIRSLQRFSRVIRLASTEEEFVQAVQDVLSGENPSLPSERRSLARENSWEDRVERISQFIESRLLLASSPSRVSR
jgi:glycosyltransferase involved in cell wall biosynthesis